MSKMNSKLIFFIVAVVVFSAVSFGKFLINILIRNIVPMFHSLILITFSDSVSAQCTRSGSPRCTRRGQICCYIPNDGVYTDEVNPKHGPITNNFVHNEYNQHIHNSFQTTHNTHNTQNRINYNRNGWFDLPRQFRDYYKEIKKNNSIRNVFM